MFLQKAMHTDQKYQEKVYKYTATVQSGKLLLQVNDGITYKGEIQTSPYYDIQELKAIFERGDVQVLTRTTSKMIIKLAILKIELLSEESKEMQTLKARVEELENRLKSEGQWEEEDLDSKANFDLNYIYKINTNAGLSSIITTMTTGTIYFFNGGANYTISNSNRRATSAGWVVTKMQRKKI